MLIIVMLFCFIGMFVAHVKKQVAADDAIWESKEYSQGERKKLSRIARVLFLTTCTVFCICLVGAIIIPSMTYTKTVTNEVELVALNDTTEISGSISGRLFYVQISQETEEVYSFYYKTNNNGLKRGKVPSNNTTIYEVDDIQPTLIKHTAYTKNKINDTLATILMCWEPESQDTYEIYVPKGTVIKELYLDAQ